jgi:hypothetical protein
VADRLYLPTADGGRTVADALSEAYRIVHSGRALVGDPAPEQKCSARYNFGLPGAVQGWLPDEAPDSRGTTRLENVAGHSALGERSVAIRYHGVAEGRQARVLRETMPAYPGLVASPALYAGQTVRATLQADAGNAAPITARLLVKALGAGEGAATTRGPETTLAPGESATLAWKVETEQDALITWVGLELTSARRADGSVYLDTVDWQGVPRAELVPAQPAHDRWLSGWVQAVSALGRDAEHALRLVQNSGVGLAIQGQREWTDHTVSARLVPHLARSFGLAARVQGLRRYYALRLVAGGVAQLVRELDGTHVLAEMPYAWELYRPYDLSLTVRGSKLLASVNGVVLFGVEDAGSLSSGAVGLMVEEGRLGCDWARIR